MRYPPVADSAWFVPSLMCVGGQVVARPMGYDIQGTPLVGGVGRSGLDGEAFVKVGARYVPANMCDSCRVFYNPIRRPVCMDVV